MITSKRNNKRFFVAASGLVASQHCKEDSVFFSMRQKIAQYIGYNPRNKLVFAPRIDPHLTAVDVGYELSELIKGHLSSPHLPMIASDALRKIFENALMTDEIIDPYVAFKNWGILFEPDLKLDLIALLDSYSRDKVLILVNCGEVDNQDFHLVSKNFTTMLTIEQLHPYIIS